MKAHITNLGGVVNKDIAFSKSDQNIVYDSQNFRITAADNGTLSVRTNIRGNVNVIDIPNTNAQWKIDLSDTSFLVSGYDYNFILNGENITTNTTGTLNWNVNYLNIQTFYQNLVDQINTVSTQPTSFLFGSSASVSSDFTFITITGPLSLLNIASFTQTFPLPVPVVNYNTFVNIVQLIPALSGLQIIGWTTLRDDIILITTNGTFNPDDPTTGPFTSYGQIWKLSYDKSADVALSTSYNLTLLYNNQLDLTIYRPIANPGMIEVRYENSSVTPMYWTDNYNNPRKANLADPSLATYTPNRLNLLPALNLDNPKLKRMVSGGNLKMGVYQFAYRLKNLNGSETKFSRPSKLIPIIDAQESVAYNNYFPRSVYNPITGVTSDAPNATGNNTGGDSNKSVKIGFNVDPNFDIIEIISVYYENNTSVPECFIIKTDAVPANGYYETVVDSSSNDIPITIDEVTAFNPSIIRCKTLAAKAQTLFIGNVSITDQDINFDARTYRFPKNSNTTIIKNNNIDYLLDSSFKINQVGPNPVIPYDVPEEHDCIQDYDSQAPNSDLNNLYLPNSSILGGEGPSIKYVFVTEQMLLDDRNTPSITTFFGGAQKPHMRPPYKSINKSSFTLPGINGATVENIDFFGDNNSPYLYDVLVGYRRDEMERFGIVFFDEFDNPSFVKWIGDIRMPHQFMPHPTPGLPRTMLGHNNYTAVLPEGDINIPGGDEFISRITNVPPDPNDIGHKKILKGNILGLRITIKNFNGIPDRFKKAGIVRVPKQESDKHIIGQGLFRATYKSPYETGSGDWIFTSSCDYGFYTDNMYWDVDQSLWNSAFTFVSPEFLFDAVNSTYQTNDKIDVVGILRTDNLYHPTNSSANIYIASNNDILVSDTSVTDGVLENPAEGDVDKFLGLVIKTYFLDESPTSPHPIKDSNSKNPYSIRNTRNIYTVGNYEANFEPAYEIPGGSFDTPAKTIYNCSVKSPLDSNWFPESTVMYREYFSNCNKSKFIQLDVNSLSPLGDNFNYSAYGGDDYFEKDKLHLKRFNSSTKSGFNHYLANYRREVASQFGGNNFNARSLSEYIDTGCILNITNKTTPITTKVFGGDTTVAVMDYMAQFTDISAMIKADGQITNLNVALLFPCETSIAIDYRRNYKNYAGSNMLGLVTNRSTLLGNKSHFSSSRTSVGFRQIDTYEEFLVDSVYNYTDKRYIKYYPKPSFTIIEKDFDARVWRSEKKLDSAAVDSWVIFKPSSFLDVESKYGPINNLIVFQDKLLFFQDKAFGQLQVNEQKLISDAAGGADLVLGSSGLLERYDYISRQTGTKHQFSMSVSDYSLVWFDVSARKLYRLGQGLNPLSDLKGYHAFLYENTKGEFQDNDNPYIFKGIHSTYDYRFNEFYMTFLSEDKQFTLVYNDMFEGFVGEYTHYPVVYINDKSNIFSVPYSPLNSNIFIHNYGNYGVFYNNPPAPSKISYVVNPELTLEKVFTNLELAVESFKTVSGYEEPDFYDFFDTMRVYDNYQNTDFIPTAGIRSKHKTIWDLKVPSDRVLDVTQPIFNTANLNPLRPALTRRMKDKWFTVDFIYNNTNNNKLVAHYASNLYMINSR